MGSCALHSGSVTKSTRYCFEVTLRSVTAESDRVVHAHFAAHATNFRRIADIKFDLPFQHDPADNLRTRTNDDLWLALVIIPAPAAWFLDDQVAGQRRAVMQRDVAVYGLQITANL